MSEISTLAYWFLGIWGGVVLLYGLARSVGAPREEPPGEASGGPPPAEAHH